MGMLRAPCLLLWMTIPLGCLAQDQDRKGPSVGAITPIYSQLVRISYPVGFKFAHQNDSGTYYIQESVLDGETVKAWSQMVTVTGSKGLAANPNVTPERLVQQIAGGFQRACPNTFAAKALGALQISGHDAFVALIGCGSVTSGIPRSEIAMLLAVKGASDYYTIQWAERSPPSDRAAVLDETKWLNRLKQLNPVKLCARIPNEPPPYPSCVNQK